MLSRDHLRDLIRLRAFRFGDFTLASGQKSDYYVDSKQLFTGEILSGVGKAFVETLGDLTFGAVGGLEVGAISLAAAFLMYNDQRSTYAKKYEGFFVRKEPKKHGSKQLIEGNLVGIGNVVILDDVLTTGQSALQACKAVEEEGHKVVAVCCLVDRLQGARECLSAYDYRSIFTVKDFGVNPLMFDTAPPVGTLVAPLAYSNMTDRSRKVLGLADAEARRLNHSYIGVEHLLIALLNEGSGVAAAALRNLGVDLKVLRHEVEKLAPHDENWISIGKAPYTPRFKTVADFALAEAARMDDKYVGTEHLLIALANEQEGVAAQVFASMGIKLYAVRDEVHVMLGMLGKYTATTTKEAV